ncbi:hypothetical protein PR048_001983 [Dryococelus australis]|uniref:CCHC-type domain-containing protein n=1 Tax=Dryococelus australis TaxID=614101 RepID=A0ABQ9IJ16_9NEOP|nr:hypothetical protein PR048_001983 [Dryococelus australis]
MGKNYGKAVESLRSRFGCEDMLIEVYICKLLNLTIQSISDNYQLSFLALETLGVVSNKYAAMLFLLVESCLDVLHAWQRSTVGHQGENKPMSLMEFLRKEVEPEERISITMNGFSISSSSDSKLKMVCDHATMEANSTTAPCLVNTKGKSKCCFVCLRIGHIAKWCKMISLVCDTKHIPVMCPKLKQFKTEPPGNIFTDDEEKTLVNHSSPDTLLQMHIVAMKGKTHERQIRILIDTGSPHSYITKGIDS